MITDYDRTLTKNILVIGNPGSGKSTLLNSLVKKPVFKSGISRTGAGVTFRFDVHSIGELKFFDTPGLVDIEHRQQAARAVTEALQQEGLYKIFFVVSLDAGRLRPDDSTIIRLVKESAPEMCTFHLIINKVGKKVKTILAEDKAIYDLLLRGGLTEDQLPTQTMMLDNLHHMEEEEDSYIVDCDELCEFVRNAGYVQIHSENVTELQIEGYDELRAEIETFRSKINSNEEEMAKIRETSLRLQQQKQELGEQVEREKQQRLEELEKHSEQIGKLREETQAQKQEQELRIQILKAENDKQRKIDELKFDKLEQQVQKEEAEKREHAEKIQHLKEETQRLEQDQKRTMQLLEQEKNNQTANAQNIS